MRRTFAIVTACCLFACASQPERASSQDSARLQTAPIPATAATPAGQETGARAYLDDYDLLLIQSAPSKRKVVVLGSGSN